MKVLKDPSEKIKEWRKLNLPAPYYGNRCTVEQLQKNKGKRPLYAFYKGLVITVSYDEHKSFEFYSKEWHRKYGPKITISNRSINIYKNGVKVFQIFVPHFRGNYLTKAIHEYEAHTEKPV